MAVDSRRKTTNVVALGLSVLATVIGLFFLAVILITLVVKGLGAISPEMFTQNTPPPGSAGGLLNAIFGSIAMTAIAIIVATPIGILAGTYLSEYSRGSWIAELAKFINDILLSAPSIIIGLFVYTLLVVPFRHLSGWAGAASLGLIVLPVINRTTQDMLQLVPSALREAAAALGTPRWKTMTFIIYRAARSGILTGVLLAIARITGETAPLLFTALNNQFWSADLSQPIANLPVVIFQFALSPYDDWQKLAWTGALIITISVLALSIAARALTGTRKAS